jgi:hypothetical protein
VSVLTVIQDVCRRVGIANPETAFGSTARDMQELTSLSNEVGSRIVTDYDWNRLKRLQAYTGDGSTTAFDLPTDYDRMPDPQNLYSSNWTIGPLRRVVSHDQWLFESVQAFGGTTPAWTILRGQMQFYPAPAADETISWYYMSNLYARSSGTEATDYFPLDIPFEFPDSEASGTRKAQFDDDDDGFQIDEKLLFLGMLWQWKAYKGLPYAEDMATYDRLLERRILKDGGSRFVIVGGSRAVDDGLTYPRELQG